MRRMRRKVSYVRYLQLRLVVLVGERLLPPVSRAKKVAMSTRQWFEMPIAGRDLEDRIRPKYPVENTALLVYQRDKVYVSFQDPTAQASLTKYSDVRPLAPADGRAFEEALPYLLPPPDSRNAGLRDRPVGLGDLVASITSRLRVRECHGCRQRKRWMNKVVIWGWWRGRSW